MNALQFYLSLRSLPPAALTNLDSVIADLVKKLEDQKAEAERQLKVLSRQIKVSKLQFVQSESSFITPRDLISDLTLKL